MMSITLEFPDEMLTGLGRTPQDLDRDLRLAGAIFWYGQGMIAQDRAAAIAGLDRTEFLLALARVGVDAFQLTPEELKEEVELALQTRRERLAAHLPDPGGFA
jgi:predicted HTH domain antitoxin